MKASTKGVIGRRPAASVKTELPAQQCNSNAAGPEAPGEVSSLLEKTVWIPEGTAPEEAEQLKAGAKALFESFGPQAAPMS